MSNTWLVVGLGNPGPDYSRTRHNIGFLVADELAGRIGASFRSHKSRALLAEGRLTQRDSEGERPKLVLAKPQTFMNLSGAPTAALAKFFGIPADHTIVLQDEIDLPFNTIKLKLGGGEGGHNGLRDISRTLSTKDYYRVRVGVGRPSHGSASDHVLNGFSAAEKKELPFLIQDAADAAETLILTGLLEAQQKFHAPK
ncbi:PTH1 family peptidyl-tRNA hydrolase [Psychromicrobium silvestre]|uniref:Peptidyl-tRNA hydrolase n=1 Tax=Psychromicrobium silvestre TaxID=1645614 RepID=A0A7Y9S855_9MICC|nr:aminoacyl-tRNA hydrolase [Psychromicrobium silvestre]NYE96573.1 PTH1 family peptidyl-tRNA hydrolase [Psychromicrobium silvestre]